MTEDTIIGYNLSQLIKRLPNFEPSYETLSHKKVPETYDFALAIPTGKKSYLWFTFYKGGDSVFLIDMNKDGRVLKCVNIQHIYNSQLNRGTLLQGVYLQESHAFIVEDLYYYKGMNLKGLTPGEKLIYLQKLISGDVTNTKENMTISMPVCWQATIHVDDVIPEDIKLKIPYNVHHIQFRVLNDHTPFINVVLHKRPVIDKKRIVLQPSTSNCILTIDYNRIHNGMRFTFIVKADLQCDIYRLYASGSNGESIYYNTAYIPDYNTSVYMNSHFRTIKENQNIDLTEESDDEADFQNTDIAKNVDLNKEIIFECEYKHKFKRWIPRRVIIDDNYKIVHISNLVLNYM